MKETLFYKKAEMLKIWKFSNFLPLSPTKCCYWNVFFPICNNFSEQNCLDKPVFNSARRINHSFSMNNTVTNKIRHFLQLFTFGPPILLKRKWFYFLYWSIISTKLEIYVYNYKYEYIYLLQAICLVTINIWLYFLLITNPYLH